MAPSHADEQIAIPSLLRAARGAYSNAITRALEDADCPKPPRGGVLLVAALASRDLQPEGLIGQVARGPRRKALLDELEELGYFERAGDQWQATALARRAAEAIQSAIVGVDAELTRRIGEEHVEALRAGLIALCEIREAQEAG